MMEVVTARQLANPSFWSDLAPDLHISDNPFAEVSGSYQFGPDESDRLRRQVCKEGYFQSMPILDLAEIRRLASGIESVSALGILPIFVSVYDEFWQLLFKLRHTLRPILGNGYRSPPEFWVWNIRPGAENRGWMPHRDALFSDTLTSQAYVTAEGQPRMCTVWIPLTDATTHNSCIYVLPRPHDPMYQSFMRGDDIESIEKYRQALKFTNARALPAPAGSVLGWSPYLLHWGSQSTEWATAPRISLGIYYMAADMSSPLVPFDHTGRLYLEFEPAPRGLLTFNQRVTIIANNLAKYHANGQMVNERCFSPAAMDFSEDWRFNGRRWR